MWLRTKHVPPPPSRIRIQWRIPAPSRTLQPTDNRGVVLYQSLVIGERSKLYRGTWYGDRHSRVRIHLDLRRGQPARRRTNGQGAGIVLYAHIVKRSILGQGVMRAKW